jgi:hypothetical protein
MKLAKIAIDLEIGKFFLENPGNAGLSMSLIN